jgi:hypothetical protein
MSPLKTHVSISCDVYPELYDKLNAISNPNKRAELLKTLAEDGRRWRDGTYAVAPSPASSPSPRTNMVGGTEAGHAEESEESEEDGFKLPEMAIQDAKDADW